MTKRPLLSANLRSVPTGLREANAAPSPGAQVIEIASRGSDRPVAAQSAPERPETAASIVVDAFATASVLSYLAWSQSALLPLRLAAYAWQQALPRAAAGERPPA